MEEALNVVVIDANLTLRKGTELLLRSWGHHVVGVAQDAEAGYGLAVKRRPGVIVADADAPGRDAYALARRTAATHPRIAVVLQIGEPSLADLEEAMRCGARGLTLKRDEPDELRRAVRVAGAGQRHVASAVERLAQTMRSNEARVLSTRERQVLQLLADGTTGEEAARILGVAPETVRIHVKNAMRKLRTKTRVHAVTRAVASGEIRL
jgi:DNA-binding NarL/FixJ family response regulator